MPAPTAGREMTMIAGPIAYVGRLVALVATSFAAFLALYVAIRAYAPDPIVFYQGLSVVAASSVALRAVGWAISRTVPPAAQWVGHTVLVPAIAIHALLGYAFVITIPSLLDRSISIYVIAAVAQSGERGLTREELQAGFLRDYVSGTATIDKRLAEQLASGHVADSGGRLRTTERGERVYRVNRALAHILNIPSHYTEPPPAPTDPRAGTN